TKLPPRGRIITAISTLLALHISVAISIMPILGVVPPTLKLSQSSTRSAPCLIAYSISCTVSTTASLIIFDTLLNFRSHFLYREYHLQYVHQQRLEHIYQVPQLQPFQAQIYLYLY